MKNANLPAYPVEVESSGAGLRTGEHKWFEIGLTKREYFAVMAMQGICANSIPGEHHMPKRVAQDAVEFADELLKQLEKF